MKTKEFLEYIVSYLWVEISFSKQSSEIMFKSLNWDELKEVKGDLKEMSIPFVEIPDPLCPLGDLCVEIEKKQVPPMAENSPESIQFLSWLLRNNQEIEEYFRDSKAYISEGRIGFRYAFRKTQKDAREMIRSLEKLFPEVEILDEGGDWYMADLS